MLKVPSRAELARLAGKPVEREPEPKPVPPEPIAAPALATSPQVEQALVALSKHVQEVASMAAQANAGVAALAARPDVVMEAQIQRDTLGRMEKIVITRKKP